MTGPARRPAATERRPGSGRHPHARGALRFAHLAPAAPLGFTIVEAVVGASVAFLAIAIVWSFYLGAVSGTVRATESSDAVRSVLIAEERIRQDVCRMRFQAPGRDLAIAEDGRSFSVTVPRQQTDDFWNTHHDPLHYRLEKIAGAADAFRLIREENGKAAPVGGCTLKAMSVRRLEPGDVSALQSYLQVTLVGLGSPGGKATYTASVLLPLTQMVPPEPYSFTGGAP